MTEYAVYAVYLIVILLVVAIVYLRDIDRGLEWISRQIGQVSAQVSCLPMDINRVGILHGSDDADTDLFE
jgi:preprotein translocase subunit SecY